MNKRLKRSLSIVLAFVVCLGFSGGYSMTTKAENSHWSNNTIASMEKYNDFNIFEGNFNPDEAITRAEFVALVNSAFGFVRTTGAKTYIDVNYFSKYGEDIKISSAVGYMFDYGVRFLPDDTLSRERAFSILAGIHLLTDEARVKTRFLDDVNIGQYARPEVSAMDKAGYLESFPDGTLHPEKELTKGEAAQVISNMLGNRPGLDRASSGTATYKNLTVYRPGLTINNLIVSGDLFITDGVGDGDVNFTNVKVKGVSLVMGGGSNSVDFSKSELTDVIIGGVNYTNLALNDTTLDSVTFISSGKITFPNSVIDFNAETGALKLTGVLDEIVDLGDGTFRTTYEGNTLILKFAHNLTVRMIENFSFLSKYSSFVPTDTGGSGRDNRDRSGDNNITSRGSLYVVKVGIAEDSVVNEGSVSIDGVPAPGTRGLFQSGQTVTVRATAEEGIEFKGWYNDIDHAGEAWVNGKPEYSFIVTGHTELFGVFEYQQ